jgi:hypothetical protein
MLNTALEQNYVKLHNQYYKQKDGLATGASTSSTSPILGEVLIVMQYLVHTKIVGI